MSKPIADVPTDLHLSSPLPADQNPAAVYLAGLSTARSRRTMVNALRSIIAVMMGLKVRDVSEEQMLIMNWNTLRYQHTVAIRARLIERYSAASANRMLSALRGVLKEAWRLGQMSAEDYHRAVDIQNVRGETVPAGREVTQGEILALVEGCKRDSSPFGKRDAAIIGLLYTCGLRRTEIVSLSRRDVNLDSGRIVIKLGKGNKQRTVFAQGGALRAIADWVEVVGNIDPDEALFLPIRRDGTLEYRQMSTQSIYDMLRRRAKQVGIPAFSPHDLRRTFVGDMLDRGVDIATVANIAGHSSVDTTRRYDRRPEKTKQDAAARLLFPY